MKLLRLYSLLVLLCISQNDVIAQDAASKLNAESIDVATYEKIKSEVDFSKTKKAIRPKKKKKEEVKKEETSLFDLSFFQGARIFQVLSYILIIALVFFLVYFIFSRIESDKKFELSKENLETEEIEDINQLDTDSLLNQAIANGNYRLAVRMKFLSILKSLSQQEKIIWRKEKTNRDYSRELRSQSFGTEFQNVASIFDIVWYGKKQIPKETYEQIEVQMNSLSKLLNG